MPFACPPTYHGPMTLKDQTAVITGGGRGLGRVFAHALAEAAADIVLLGRTQRDLDDAASAIGSSARAIVADVTDSASVADAFRQIGPVDILINNAGILGPICPFADAD